MPGKYRLAMRAKGGLRRSVLAACLVLAGSAAVQALDFNDVQNLIRNHVPEGAIITLVQQDPNLTITQDQANQLRALGASESIVYAIRPAASSSTVIQQSPTGTYVAPGGSTYTTQVQGYPADGGSYATGGTYSDYSEYDNDYDDYESEYYQQVQQSATQPVAQYPSGTVASQTTPVYGGTTQLYDSNGNPLYDTNGNPLMGNVSSTSSYGGTPVYDSGITYTDPTVVYQSSPQVIVQQPTVVYDTTPTYVYDSGPTFGFDIRFGRDRDRWHRPPPPRPPSYRPPSHRPPPPPPHRPGPGGKPGPKPGDRPGDRPGSKPGDRPGDKPGDRPSWPGDRPSGGRR